MRLCICYLLIGALASAGCATTSSPSPRASAHEAFDELRDHIRAQISDTEKRARLLGYADELEGLMAQAIEDKISTRAQLVELNQNYEATAEEFAALFASARSSRLTRQNRMIEIHAAARALMTPEEWTSINSFKSAALEAALEASLHPEPAP